MRMEGSSRLLTVLVPVVGTMEGQTAKVSISFHKNMWFACGLLGFMPV